MMLVISAYDFKRLSSATQRELISALSSNNTGAETDDMGFIGQTNEDAPIVDAYLQHPHQPTVDDVLGGKRVVNVTVEQAGELVANISEKSLETLKIFVLGKSVSLGDLIGKKNPYRDFNDLKRSFVGAVNRRLRTVTGNRSAVLFASDRDKMRIRVTPQSAAALRQALDVQEPLPVIEFYETSGKHIDIATDAVRSMQEKLQLAWHDFPGRPINGRPRVEQRDAIKYLIENGFQAQLGVPVEFDDKTGSDIYTFSATSEAPSELVSRLDRHGSIHLGDKNNGECAKVFLRHNDVPDVFAKI